MACSSCSSGKEGSPKGCKNNGTCGTDGCNKLTVFNWLSNMSLPSGTKRFDFVEVRFKNGRKEYCKFSDELSLSIGDIVATEATSGHDIGMVSLSGELVRIQMKKKKAPTKGNDVKKVYRKATQRDIDIWQEVKDKEDAIKFKAREIAISLSLKMKISDVEYQGDGSKLTFYYTAEDRVDFRQLIKEFARAFSTRIEMRQIGFRQEAARLGGIGSCGRELCCSTWLTDFRSVNTSAARYQQLALNPQKLAGQCGKLKCCLNFELDAYMEALSKFPRTEVRIKTGKGLAVCQKIDIFRGILWYAYKDHPVQWHMVSVENANKMIADSRKGKLVSSLEDFAIEPEVSNEILLKSQSISEDSLTRFDKPKKGSRNKNWQRRKKTATSNRSNTKESKATDVATKERKQRDRKSDRSKGNYSENSKVNGGKPDARKPQRKKPFRKKPSVNNPDSSEDKKVENTSVKNTDTKGKRPPKKRGLKYKNNNSKSSDKVAGKKEQNTSKKSDSNAGKSKPHHKGGKTNPSES